MSNPDPVETWVDEDMLGLGEEVEPDEPDCG